jgi:putative phosphoesterase
MRLAILSDTHSNDRNVAAALKLIEKAGVDAVLHCGDITEASTVHLFEGKPAHFVLGNCDYDPEAIDRAVKEIGGTFHGRFAALELAGKHIAMIHGDDHKRMQDKIAGGRFDYLFYGHTHQAEQHRAGPTLVVNPGALHRAHPKTFVILDLVAGTVESVRVAE